MSIYGVLGQLTALILGLLLVLALGGKPWLAVFLVGLAAVQLAFSEMIEQGRAA